MCLRVRGLRVWIGLRVIFLLLPFKSSRCWFGGRVERASLSGINIGTSRTQLEIRDSQFETVVLAALDGGHVSVSAGSLVCTPL